MDCSDRRSANFSVSHKKQRKARKKQGILYDAHPEGLDKSCGNPAFLLACRRKVHLKDAAFLHIKSHTYFTSYLHFAIIFSLFCKASEPHKPLKP
jgi:hypothetical protein